uniref:fibroblast growth factor-binding protein 1 n=1 Tax=Jaculus jaculus TaxID=51337 RepID=UPI001E1B3E8B|nr:fibroblast growth factor-binding protein 1 [Jaculus jaculus]
MRIHGLTLLSILLLAAQVLSEKVRSGAKSIQRSKPDEDLSAPLGKAQNKQRSKTSKSMTNGKFVTKDLTTCKWAVIKQELGITLKVECTNQEHQFSCVFAGDPSECLKHNQDRVYWKQIARMLRKQKNICGSSKSVLKTRVCKKQFPESNLKLATPNSLGNMKPEMEEAELTSQTQESSSEVKESTSSPAVTQPVAIKDPECVDDPDVANQRKTALEFCGESWSSFCSFLLNMLQATSC